MIDTESPAAPVSEGGGELVKQRPPRPALAYNFHKTIESTVALCGSGHVDKAYRAQRDAQQWVRAAQTYMDALTEELASLSAALTAAEERAKEAELIDTPLPENIAEAMLALDGDASYGSDAWRASELVRSHISHLAFRASHFRARATRAESERDEALRALEPFVIGTQLFYSDDPDDRVVSIGRWADEERVLPRFYADTRLTVAHFRRASALFSRLQSGNVRQQEVREQSEAESARLSSEKPVV